MRFPLLLDSEGVFVSDNYQSKAIEDRHARNLQVFQCVQDWSSESLFLFSLNALPKPSPGLFLVVFVLKIDHQQTPQPEVLGRIPSGCSNPEKIFGMPLPIRIRRMVFPRQGLECN